MLLFFFISTPPPIFSENADQKVLLEEKFGKKLHQKIITKSINPFCIHSNGKSLASMLIDLVKSFINVEKHFHDYETKSGKLYTQCLLECFYLYPKQMNEHLKQYYPNDKKIVFLLDNPKFLNFSAEYLSLIGRSINLGGVLLINIRSDLQGINQLSDYDCDKLITMIDVLLSNKDFSEEINGPNKREAISTMINDTFESFPLTFLKELSQFELKKIINKDNKTKILKLLLAHGLLYIDKTTTYRNENLEMIRFIGNRDFIIMDKEMINSLKEIMSLNEINYFYNLRLHNHVGRKKNLLEKKGDDENCINLKENRTRLAQAINASSPFISNSLDQFSKGHLTLKNLYPAPIPHYSKDFDKQLSTFNLLANNNNALYDSCYTFLDNRKINFKNESDEITSSYLRNIALFINHELINQLSNISNKKYNKNYTQWQSFDEIMEESQKLFNSIIEIEADGIWKELSAEKKNIFFKNVFRRMIKMCLRQHNTTYYAFRKSINQVVRNSVQIFSSPEDTEHFFLTHKNDSFKELQENLKIRKKWNPVKMQKHHEKFIEKRNHIKFQDIMGLINKEVKEKTEDKRLKLIHTPIIENFKPRKSNLIEFK